MYSVCHAALNDFFNSDICQSVWIVKDREPFNILLLRYIAVISCMGVDLSVMNPVYVFNLPEVTFEVGGT